MSGKPKKVALISIRGLPPRYGAFEQTADQLVRHANRSSARMLFLVPCETSSRSLEYDLPNVRRFFLPRMSGIGVILYGLLGMMLSYFAGARCFVFFGYGMAPFFPLIRLIGCEVTCNVDGIEWRRSKWGRMARRYFRLCEWISAKSGAELIYDAHGIARYYAIKHRRPGHVLFYGTEQFTEAVGAQGADLPDGRYFVTVMRMEPENNILTMVEAFRASSASMRFCLIGPSTDFFDTRVRPIIRTDPRIEYLGPIYERERLWRIRHGAIGYLHGHSVGGTNPTLVEAAQIGRPIIAYGSIFNREVLGSTGTYFRTAANLTAILDGTEAVWNKPPRALPMDYTWECVADRYLRLISK